MTADARLTYRRAGGEEDEQLTIAADGALTVWRTAARRRVGAFGRILGTAELDGLVALADAAAAAEAVYVQPPRGASLEQMSFADGHSATFSVGVDLPPPVAALADALRSLTASAVEAPVAALDAQLELGEAPATLVLAVVGTEALGVEPDAASLAVEVVTREAAIVDRYDARLADLLGAEAPELDLAIGDAPVADGVREPGWSEEVVLGRALALADAERVTWRLRVPVTWQERRVIATLSAAAELP